MLVVTDTAMEHGYYCCYEEEEQLSSLFFVVSGLRTKLLGGLGAEVTLIQNIYALICDIHSSYSR